MPNYTILLIDYEPRSVESLRGYLESDGHRVEVASNGIAGLESFESLRPDLVLVEAMIPKKHGFDVCQEIKRTPHGKTTPVVILTAVYRGRKYRNQALHHYGCDEYLEKPVAEDTLREVVGRLLGGAAPNVTPPRPAPMVSDPAALPAAPSGNPEELTSEIMARLDEILPGGSQVSAETAADPVATMEQPTADEAVTTSSAPVAEETPVEKPVESVEVAQAIEIDGAIEIAIGAGGAIEVEETIEIEEAIDADGAIEVEETIETDAADDDTGIVVDLVHDAVEDAGVEEPISAEELTALVETPEGFEPTSEASILGDSAEPEPTQEDPDDNGEADRAALMSAIEELRDDPLLAVEDPDAHGTETTGAGADAAETVEPKGRKRRRGKKSRKSRKKARKATTAPVPPQSATREAEPPEAAAVIPEIAPSAAPSPELEALREEAPTVSEPEGRRKVSTWIWITAAAGFVLGATGLFLVFDSRGGETDRVLAQATPRAPEPAVPALGAADTGLRNAGVSTAEGRPADDGGSAAARRAGSGPSFAVNPTGTDRAALRRPQAEDPASAPPTVPPEPTLETEAATDGSEAATLEIEGTTDGSEGTVEPRTTTDSGTTEATVAEGSADDAATSAPLAPPGPEIPEIESEPPVDPTTAQPGPSPSDDRPEPRLVTAAPGFAAPQQSTSAGERSKPSASMLDDREQPNTDEPDGDAGAARPEQAGSSDPEPVSTGMLVEFRDLDVQPRVVSRDLPEYTPRALRLRQQGIVVLRLLIDENGDVADIVVVESIPNSDLHQAAVEAARGWKYTPGVVRGRRVKVWKQERVQFQL